MNIPKTSLLLYRVRETCTAIELLFPNKWWINFLTKIGLIQFHGLANEAHNELVRARSLGLQWDYNAFMSKVQYHRNFADPLRMCADCRKSVRMIPTLKNILMKKLRFKSHKNAVLLAVD